MSALHSYGTRRRPSAKHRRLRRVNDPAEPLDPDRLDSGYHVADGAATSVDAFQAGVRLRRGRVVRDWEPARPGGASHLCRRRRRPY